MTIAVKITNEDSRDNAVIKVTSKIEGELDDEFFLKGGDVLDTYIWDGKTLLVKEVQNG